MEQNLSAKVSDVFLHHMNALLTRQMDALMQDYSEESVLFSPDQTFHGKEQIQAFFTQAIAAFPDEFFTALTPIHQDIQGEVAYVTWKAEPFVKMATDTFVIREGKIIAQTFLMVF